MDKKKTNSLPNLSSPIQQQKELNVIETTNNIKANVPIDHWQPSSKQLHFYEESFREGNFLNSGKHSELK